LYHQHASRPRNPLLANALFRTRLIEQWGTGTLRIIEACRPHNIKVEFESAMGMFIVRLKQLSPPSAAPESQPESGAQSGVQSGAQSGVQSKMAVLILGGLKKAIMGKAEVAEMLGKSGRTRYLNDLMKKILDSGFVEYTIPDKPNSRLQKYRLTAKGLSLLPREKQ
jgi:ATP-dependent DNA helicase RecG